MKQRRIGSFSVSAIGLGCMNMSMGYGPRPEDDYSIQLLQKALDTGYDFLDTASLYGQGHNEQLVGQALAHRRDEFVLASKCGIYRNQEGKLTFDGRPERIRETCESSLRNLKTDVIDLYYLHRLDPEVPIEESVGALGQLVEEGKLQSIGLSEISSETLRRAHREYPVTAVQSEYSLWVRTPERKMLETCRELGVTFVAFSPLGRQFLTGQAVDVTQLEQDDIRASIARPRFEPDNFKRNQQLLEPFAAMAERLGCSMAQLALAWVLAVDETVIPIPGTKHIDWMQENADAITLELDAGVMAELDDMIHDDVIAGARYNDELMRSIDSERD